MFTDWILAAVGSAALVIFALRMITHYGKAEWGAIVTLFIASVVVFGVTFLPDQTLAVLADVWEMILNELGASGGEGDAHAAPAGAGG